MSRGQLRGCSQRVSEGCGVSNELEPVSFDDTSVGLKNNGGCRVRFHRQHFELADLSWREPGAVTVDIEEVAGL